MSENARHERKTKQAACTRRGFMSGAAALSFTIVKPELVRGFGANSKIDVALIGCGNRAGWIGSLFLENGNYRVVAGADYFQDQVDALGEKFQFASSRRHAGLSGYRQLLDSKPDAVVIETPPYYHPEHAMAAVDAGCHVFVAKPLAVDVPGCLKISDAGKKATGKNLCFLVDFQTRADPRYQEAVRRVHNGDIGQIVNGEAVYYAGPTWKRHISVLVENPSDPELQLRAWGVNRILSGDIITEQNIHAVDVASWIVDANPLKAYGTGSRKARVDEPGDCYDNFSVVYYFPNNVTITFTSGQFSKGYRDIGCRVFGPAGSIDTHYFGDVSIIGDKPYAGGEVDGLFKNGVVNNIATFHRSITEGDCANHTVEAGVRSNLTTILGRTAAYRQTVVTWDEMMKAREKLVFEGENKLTG